MNFFIGFSTGEEELFEFKFDINEVLFKVVFIGFANKESDHILLLKIFILLLFEGIKGFKWLVLLCIFWIWLINKFLLSFIILECSFLNDFNFGWWIFLILLLCGCGLGIFFYFLNI